MAIPLGKYSLNIVHEFYASYAASVLMGSLRSPSHWTSLLFSGIWYMMYQLIFLGYSQSILIQARPLTSFLIAELYYRLRLARNYIIMRDLTSRAYLLRWVVGI